MSVYKNITKQSNSIWKAFNNNSLFEYTLNHSWWRFPIHDSWPFKVSKCFLRRDCHEGRNIFLTTGSPIIPPPWVKVFWCYWRICLQIREAFLGSRWTLTAMQQLPAMFKTTAIMMKLIWIFLQRTDSFLNYLHMVFFITHAVMHLNCFALIYSSTYYGWDFKSHESLRWLSRSKCDLLVYARLYRICKGRCSFILAAAYTNYFLLSDAHPSV